MEEKKIVYYSEFGAVGDGVHEDFEAIKKCHEYANENGCTVYADKGAKYYIGETGGAAAVVKTDVNWQDATFIIDDSIIPVESPSRTANVFVIAHDYPMKKFDKDSDIVKALNAAGGIKAQEIKNIGYAPGYPALLVVHDEEHSAYLRWGCHATGKPNPQHEIAIIDENGNIDIDTPFLLDFLGVTSIEEYRIDDKTITAQGGTFIHIANCAPPVYTSYARAIEVNRSNTVIRNVVHKIVDEGPHGAPCGGFIRWIHTTNLLCENVTLQSHASYMDYQYDERGEVKKVHSVMGSYDIGGGFSSHIHMKGCIQSDFYKWEEKRIVYNELERWGIMGSNYCKNFFYEDCTLSRLDAHAGVYNVKIKNSKITYIKLIGGGTALIENTEIYAPEGTNAALIELRGDYGSTWRGDIIIKDCEFINWKDNAAYIASALWNNWPFGYTTYLPRITIDNLKLDKKTPIYIFKINVEKGALGYDKPVLESGEENKNPMRIDTTVTVKNNNDAYEYYSSNNDYLNEKMTLICE